MGTCPKCGAELEDGQVCPCTANTGAAAGASNAKKWKFGESLKNRMGIGVPEQNATDTYERGMGIVPDCIRADENELPVKQYNIAVFRNLLKFERAEGRLQVTNKRVVLRAAGRSVRGRTTLQHEFAINEIAGFEARRNYRFSFLYLIFAFLIISLSNIIVSGKLPIIADIMAPSHVQKARIVEYAAIAQSARAQEREDLAASNRKSAEEKEKRASSVRATAEKNERTQGGGGYYYYYRDWKQERINAQNAEKKAIADRELAEKAEKQATEQRELAQAVKQDATQKRASAEKIWAVLMTISGLILGIGGLIPFFALYKRFGLKLFILNFAVVGFSLSLAASGNVIFLVLLMLSGIIELVCMFLFCFRPNLIIRIKNKGVKEAVDISRKTGFAEIIPTGETESAIREIGAIIGDIQSSGDAGVKKWAKTAESAKPPVSASPDPARSPGDPGKKLAAIGIVAGAAVLIVAVVAVIAFILTPGHKHFYAKGKACLDAENYAGAVNYLSMAIIRAKPIEAQYYYWRGTAHFSKDFYDEAIADFSEAIRLAPENASYRFDRASAYYAAKDYDKAITDYTDAIRLDPKDARYYNSRGNSYRIKEQYEKAISDHKEAIKLNPDDARYQNNLGVAYYLTKDYDNAAAAYTEAIRLAPNDAKYRNNRGSVYSLKKDFDNAVTDFTEAARLDPDNSEYGKNLEKAVNDQSKIKR